MSTKLLYFLLRCIAKKFKFENYFLISRYKKKKKKNKPEKVHWKFVPRRTNDPTMIAVQKSISRRRIRAIGRLITQCHSTPSWEMQRALFLRAFRELIIRRDCRLGNGRPSTNPDETMRARLISRRAAFNANSP